MQSASVGVTTGASASLYFNSGDKERLNSICNTGYLRVNLTGDWKKDIVDGTTTTSMRITELRLIPGNTSPSYALSSWSDVDSTTKAGVTELGSGFLKKTALSGS
jgi:hypothetical protein